MKLVNAYASEPHYLDKLVPIFNALPNNVRGTFKVHPRLKGSGKGLQVADRPDQDGILLVASHKDSLWAREKFIYVEHGVGQSYQPNNFYSNSHRPNMLAAIVPGPYCAEKTQQANPGVEVIEIGAPHLANIERAEKQKIVFSWHWRCAVALESDTAFDEYREVMKEAATKWECTGHGHPRILGELIPSYVEAKMSICYKARDALSQAKLLIADNTSLIYEAALLGIPVILLNKSTYRKFKNWGLRFWELQPGPYVDTPEELIPTIERQLAGESNDWEVERKKVSMYLYGANPFGPYDYVTNRLMRIIYDYSRTN